MQRIVIHSKRTAQYCATQWVRVQQWYQQRTHADDTWWPWWLPVLCWPSRWLMLCVALAYAGLTIVWTWPLLPEIGNGVIVPTWGVDQPDISQNIWNIWHFANTWHTGDFPLTQAIFYPQQINLLHQSYGLMQLVITAPVALLFGPNVAANSILAVSYWGSAIGMFVLLYAITKQPTTAFLGGWIIAITPAHQMNIAWAADENASIQWIVLLHLSIVWWLRDPQWRRGVLVFCALIINTLASGYLGLFGFVYTVLVVLVALLVRWIPSWHRSVIVHGVMIAAVWAGVSAVLLMSTWSHSPYQTDTFVDVTAGTRDVNFGMRDWYERQSAPSHVVSLFDLVAPTAQQRWWAWMFPMVRIQGSQMGGYIGIGVLVLLVWGVWRVATVRAMAALAAVLLMCAAGLEIRLFPDPQSPALPGLFWLFDTLSVFRNATRPGLFVLWAWIPILLIIVYALSHSRRRVLVVVALVSVWVDFTPMAWVISPQRAAASATAIRDDTSTSAGSVLTLPFGKNDARPLLDQVCHGRPITAGYLARLPAFVTSLRGVMRAPSTAEDVIPVLPIDERANLGVRFVVIKSDTPPYSRGALQAGGAQLVWHNQSEEVWKIPAVTRPALLPGAGWNDPEQDETSQWRWKKWRWSGAKSEIVILSQSDAVVRVALSVGGFANAPVQVFVNGHASFALQVPQLPATVDRVVTIPVRAGLNQVVFATTTRPDYGREIGVLFARLELRDSSAIIGGRTIPAVPQYTERWLCQ